MIPIINLPYTTEELENALPFTKGKWEPITVPLIKMEDLGEPIILDPIEMGKYKFELPTANY